MTALIYVEHDGEPQGPFSAAELSRLWQAGELDAGARYWTNGMPHWAPVSEFKAPTGIPSSSVLITAAPSIAGRDSMADLGIVAAHAIVAGDAIDDVLSAMRDAVGGRVSASERLVQSARETVFEKLRDEAARRGCDAVIATRVEHVPFGRAFLVTATGSSVRLGPPSC